MRLTSVWDGPRGGQTTEFHIQVCWALVTRSNLKERQKKSWRSGMVGGGCVVRDSCPNWHIQYERFDTINSHSYRCTRHRSLVGALSGKGVQRKQGPLAKVCDPPWIPHSRSGKEKHWQIDKGLRVVSGDADRSFRCFPAEGRCKLKLAMTVLR